MKVKRTQCRCTLILSEMSQTWPQATEAKIDFTHIALHRKRLTSHSQSGTTSFGAHAPFLLLSISHL